MVRRRRGLHQLAGDLEARRVAATLGGQMHHTRLERRLTLAGLADLTGIAPTRLHELEAGDGASAPLAAWFAVGSALDRPFAAGFSRDIHRSGEPADAGHLAAQEIVLSLSRRNARTGMFELRTRSGIREGGNVDVGIRDDRWRALILVEIWNTTADLGAASRSSARKVAEAGELAAFRGYRVASCWLLVDTAANRAMVRRYPEVLRAQFPGSSATWARCLIAGGPPPRKPGIAWIDTRSGRIRPLRFRQPANRSRLR